jgi:hypothetical protein
MSIPFICPFICRTATTQDAAASPSVAVSTIVVGELVRAIATSLLKIVVLPSFLNESLQPLERLVPPLCDMVEIAPRRLHLSWLELPDSLAATS